MKIKNLSKKVVTLALCAMFVSSAVPVTTFVSSAAATKTSTEVEAKSKIDAVANTTFTRAKLPSGTKDVLTIDLDTQLSGEGFIAFDISKDMVVKNESGAKPLTLTLEQDSSNYSEVELLQDYGTYSLSEDGESVYRFIIPCENLGNTKLKISRPEISSSPSSYEKDIEKKFNKEFKFKVVAGTISENERLKRTDYDVDEKDVDEVVEQVEKNNIKINMPGIKEHKYRGFLFGKIDGNEYTKFYMRPNATASNIRLHLDAEGKGSFSYSNDKRNNEYTISVYSDEDMYKKIKESSKSEKKLLEDNKGSYQKVKVKVQKNTSVNLIWPGPKSIIEIELKEPNFFETCLYVENSNTSINTSGSERDNISSGTIIKDNGSNISGETAEDKKIDATAKRFSGSDRYKTSLELSKKAFDKADTAVLASGQNFADALSGGSLAAINNAPLLLVNNSSADAVNAELNRLGVKKVYVLGGLNSVSEAIANKVSENSRTVVRLSGADRYATSMEVYKEFVKMNGAEKSPILVNGTVFADALSAGPLAADTNRAIVLTNGKSVSSEINKDDTNNIVIGGYKSMDNEFKGERFSGADRYDTSVKIAEHFKSPENALLASGENYPDGLSAITLNHKYNGPLVLTSKNSLPSGVENFITGKKVSNVYIIGGANSVSNSIEKLFK